MIFFTSIHTLLESMFLKQFGPRRLMMQRSWKSHVLYGLWLIPYVLLLQTRQVYVMDKIVECLLYSSRRSSSSAPDRWD